MSSLETLTRGSRRLLLATAMAFSMVALLAAPAFGAHEGTAYEAELTALNNSGATGDAYVQVSEDGETMTVDIDANGFNLDSPHAMHIHAIVDGDDVAASSCPTMSADSDGDGIVDVVEGVPFYGSVQVSLTTEGDASGDSALAVERYPAGTALEYSRSGISIPEALKPNLDKVHIVVHGVDENGNGSLDMDQENRSSLTDDLPREATAPALCGELTAVAQGVVQTGAGGTADAGAPWAAIAVALGAVATATLVINRRTREEH